MKKITVLGGGTGTFVVLSALKKYNYDLAAIMTMMDSGGSTGKLRDQLGVLPPGDLRQSLVALSEASELWRKLFLYRFELGDLKGHNFGNIFLSALEKVSSNYDEVIDTASYVLHVKGKVIPVTFKNSHLGVEYESGKVIRGEGNIDEGNTERTRIKRAFLEPSVVANPSALQRLRETDYLIIGPGDLYTSIVPILLVEQIRETILSSPCKIIYIMNLMTKAGQTTRYTACDFLQDCEKYLGKEPDFVVLNNGPIPQEIIDWYGRYDSHVVLDDIAGSTYHGKVIEGDIVDRQQFQKHNVDDLTRSILRHNSEQLTVVLNGIIASS